METDEGILGTRSELYIKNSSIIEIGTSYCSAENRAGKTTLILNIVIQRNSNIVMEVRKEQFVALVILSLTALTLLIVIVMILLLKITLTYVYSDTEEKAESELCQAR